MPYLGNTPSTSFSTVVKDTFNGGSTAYTLSKVATTNSVSVFVENVRQEPTSAYSVSGTTLTFTATSPSGTGNIYVLHMNPTTTTTHPAAQNLTAVDGTFTGAFTSVGIDDNADATSITIDSSENVGIKTTTPTNYYADDLVVTAPDEGGITVVGGTTERNYLAFADGTSGDARYRGLISYDHNTDKLGIGAGGGTKIELDGNGIMTNATQPASIAYSNANNTQAFSSADTYEIVTFNTETIDKNADYSPNTFSAPVDGTYYVNANVLRTASSSGSITYDLAVYVNSSLTLYSRHHGDNSGSNTSTQNVTGLVDLDASDTVQVYARVSDTKGQRYQSQTTTYFHVFLLA